MTSYDEINNTKSIYSNISLEDIGTHYTLWSEEGQKKWYVYKCKEKPSLNKFGKTFKTSTWIMMSPGLHNQEGQLNNNWVPFMSHRTLQAINKKITEIKNQLKIKKEEDELKKRKEEEELKKRKKEEELKKRKEEEDNDPNPLWYEARKYEIDEKVKETNFKLSVGAIINKVKDCLLASQGHFLSMVDIVKNLKIESAFSFSKTTDNKRIVQSTFDSDGLEVFILFEYTYKVSDSNYMLKRVFGFSKKKIHFNGKYYIFKPKNKVTRDICNNLLNEQITKILDNANKEF
jgi:hypothetical protein